MKESQAIQQKLPTELSTQIQGVELEYCFNIENNTTELQNADVAKLLWLITETFEPELVSQEHSFLTTQNRLVTPHSCIVHEVFDQTTVNTYFQFAYSTEILVEVGPRLAFSTAWCSNALSILQACGVHCVTRIERSRRYKLTFCAPPSSTTIESISAVLYDRMTEFVYAEPLRSFSKHSTPEEVQVVPVLSQGRAALEALNETRGLGFDNWDLDFYTSVFRDTMRRDPTDVELFDIGAWCSSVLCSVLIDYIIYMLFLNFATRRSVQL